MTGRPKTVPAWLGEVVLAGLITAALLAGFGLGALAAVLT